MALIPPLTPVVPVVAPGEVHVQREGRENDLQAFQVVRATVAEGGQDKALLNLGKQQMWVETQVPLKTGQEVQLRVLDTGAQLQLQLLGNTASSRLGGMLHLLGEKFDLLPLLPQMLQKAGELGLSAPSREALAALIPLLRDFTKTPEGKGVRQMLQLLGFDLESRLAAGEAESAAQTLKNALAESAALLKDNAPALAQAAEKNLSGMELLQLCSARLGEEGVFLLPLPFPFLEQGYLTIEERSAGGEGQPQEHLVCLHLALAGIGNVRVDCLYSRQSLYLRFACDSEGKASYLSGFRGELEELLSGLPLKGLTFTVGAEDPSRALLKRVWENGGFDTRV